MDTYTESEFSDPCFIVAGTQSKDGSNDKQGNGYGVTKLKALNCVEGTCPSPEVSGLFLMVSRTTVRSVWSDLNKAMVELLN